MFWCPQSEYHHARNHYVTTLLWLRKWPWLSIILIHGVYDKLENPILHGTEIDQNHG